MTVRVLFFSVLKDVVGADEVPFNLASGATVADLLEQVFTRWPKLREWDKSLLIAVDQYYAKRDGALHENAEVAIMPPVQGG
ncbi:MAG TPA: MoaD/ThiS family protein [Candidatus Saccharimonadia bacterium]|nr:MoaD/ThiS family protein [Candidatus Saccharimonadia bacterium]